MNGVAIEYDRTIAGWFQKSRFLIIEHSLFVFVSILSFTVFLFIFFLESVKFVFFSFLFFIIGNTIFSKNNAPCANTDQDNIVYPGDTHGMGTNLSKGRNVSVDILFFFLYIKTYKVFTGFDLSLL